MCLILFAYKYHKEYPLILISNRDEFYKRPTLPADFWLDYPMVLGGRDLEQRGGWLGITKRGRFAAITNYRDPASLMDNARSRGDLVREFLCGHDGPGEYLQKVRANGDLYNGFNLLIGDNNCCLYFSKNSNTIKVIKPGIHGLSNHLLNTPWPKVAKGKDKFELYLKDQSPIEKNRLFEILADYEQAKVEELPDTGIGLEKELLLSSIFIKSPDYGTRASTILLVDSQNQVSFMERSFIPEQDRWHEVSYNFNTSS